MPPDLRPFEEEENTRNRRPPLGKRISRGLSLIQALLLDHISRDRTSAWWRGLSKSEQEDAKHGLEYLIKLLGWDENKRIAREELKALEEADEEAEGEE